VANDWSLEVAIAPDGALRRIAGAINLPKKRSFGIFKLEKEFLGFIREDSFEIWERQGRAVHGFGLVRSRRGGSRIAVRLQLPTRTKVLVGIFFALYVVVAAGIATQPPMTDVSIEEIAIALAGAAALAGIFAASAANQRADLKRFIERVFSDVTRL
jgi:hypothetical protein